MNIKSWLQTILLTMFFICCFCTGSGSTRVVFFNRRASVNRSQLLATIERKKGCPKGKMRDHRNRCRKAISFGRKPSN